MPPGEDHGNSDNGNHEEDGGDENYNVEDDNDDDHDEDGGFEDKGRRIGTWWRRQWSSYEVPSLPHTWRAHGWNFITISLLTQMIILPKINSSVLNRCMSLD